jgi:drug/metabolite transporter (DMT)-like permease
MDASQIFIIIAVVTLLAVMALWFFVLRQHGPRPLSPLSGLAFAFVIAGIIFGEDPRWLGYGLIAIGIALAVAEMIMTQRRRGSGG